VRLALARYQPNSLAGVHLSRVALADFIQLTPGRSVSVVFIAGSSPPTCNVTVTGKTYSQSRSGTDAGSTDFLKAGGTVVWATVESRTGASNPATRGTEDELDWIAGNSFQLLTRNADNQSWSGQVVLPEAPGAPGAKRMRLVIREAEGILDSAGNLRPRLVYADVLRLN
jgi:hypothetical protein